MATPVYVIGGQPRSGTSMMMQSLEAGGMEACYSQKRDQLRIAKADDDYVPNPVNLYELDATAYQDPAFPAQFEGKLIKAVQDIPLRMKPSESIRLVWMQRDPEEIRQSFMAFFGRAPWPNEERVTQQSERLLSMIRNRRDTEVLVVNYETMLAKPVDMLSTVAQFFGVDLDVSKAAAVVDPNLRRYVRDRLTVGIL